MDGREMQDAFRDLTTPLIADALLRIGSPLRLAPAGVAPLEAGMKAAGRALPARHYGSVDVFLEAMSAAQPGDFLVIDNGGRLDEGCIGDLTVLEAQACGLAGVAVWGCHRDSAELAEIGFPVFSYGRVPAGPRRLDHQEIAALRSARFGECLVTSADLVFADADGVVFAPAALSKELLDAARRISATERRQAQEIRAGRTLQEQLRFAEYLTARKTDPTYSFRRHLRQIGGAIEE